MMLGWTLDPWKGRMSVSTTTGCWQSIGGRCLGMMEHCDDGASFEYVYAIRLVTSAVRPVKFTMYVMGGGRI